MEEWSGARLLHRSTQPQLNASGWASAGLLPSTARTGERSASGESCCWWRFRADYCALVAPSFGASDFSARGAPITLASYPQASVNIHVSSQTVDLVAERIDLAIRITNELDPNLIAKALGWMWICGVRCTELSLPRVPPCCIPKIWPSIIATYSYFGDVMWRFIKPMWLRNRLRRWTPILSVKPRSEAFNVPVNGNFSANDSMVVLNATLAGEGLQCNRFGRRNPI